MTIPARGERNLNFTIISPKGETAAEFHFGKSRFRRFGLMKPRKQTENYIIMGEMQNARA